MNRIALLSAIALVLFAIALIVVPLVVQRFAPATTATPAKPNQATVGSSLARDKDMPGFGDEWSSLIALFRFINFPSAALNAVNWHFDSMRQYRALQPTTSVEDDNGVCVVDYGIHVLRDPETGILMPNDSWTDPKPTLKGFLCRFIDDAYICDASLVWSFDGKPNSIEYVTQLKNVKQIVLLNNPDDSIMIKWRNRFPAARVFRGSDLGYKNPMHGGVF